MTARLAILAALPREIAPLVHRWPIQKRSTREGWWLAANDRAVAVCAGMGADRAAIAFHLAIAEGPLHSVLSMGYAGALHSGITAGTLHWPAVVLEARTRERFECGQGGGTLLTVDHVLSPAEKQQAAAQWGASLVDMEAATIARLAGQQGLPFATLKGVSDAWNDPLPDLTRFLDANGGIRERAYAGYLVLHPWLLPGALRIGRRTAVLSRAMAIALEEKISATQVR